MTAPFEIPENVSLEELKRNITDALYSEIHQYNSGEDVRYVEKKLTDRTTGWINHIMSKTKVIEKLIPGSDQVYTQMEYNDYRRKVNEVLLTPIVKEVMQEFTQPPPLK